MKGWIQGWTKPSLVIVALYPLDYHTIRTIKNHVIRMAGSGFDDVPDILYHLEGSAVRVGRFDDPMGVEKPTTRFKNNRII